MPTSAPSLRQILAYFLNISSKMTILLPHTRHFFDARPLSHRAPKTTIHDGCLPMTSTDSPGHSQGSRRRDRGSAGPATARTSTRCTSSRPAWLSGRSSRSSCSYLAWHSQHQPKNPPPPPRNSCHRLLRTAYPQRTRSKSRAGSPQLLPSQMFPQIPAP